MQARGLYHFKPETCVQLSNLSFPHVHVCMENTLWFLAVITGSGATLEQKKTVFCFSDNSFALVHVPGAAAALPLGEKIEGWGCFTAASMQDCLGVGTSAEALLMLRGEFRVFSLCVAGNVFVASRVKGGMLCTKIVQKKSYIVYMNDWQIWDVVNILGCRDNSVFEPLFVVTSECI